MRIKSILFYLFLMSSLVSGQSIRISLLNSKDINAVTINIRQGKYLIKKGNETLGEYKKNSIFHISRFGNALQLRDKRNFIGNFNEIEFACTTGDGIISVKPINPSMDAIDYDDDCVFRLNENKLQLINKIDMEKYIAAVIEAEGGNHAKAEYYKAQAVLIRTFTIKNILKHAEEGFNLCDEVHCQAFKGRLTQNPEIFAAVISTEGMVLIDKDSVLIMSPFHSNCGGETSSAGLYWQKDLPYLESVKDPFCVSSSNATWTVSIEKEYWIKFIDGIKKSDLDFSRQDFSFTIPHRTKYVSINGIELNLREIRETFNLKSSFFSIEDIDNEIIFNGKGYGHGIGMCQQGAMEMARVGYTWMDIVHFYFHDILVADYRDMELHRFKPE
jgi:stage II sporulation protein D